MTQAILDESLEEITLDDLVDGQEVYTVPWAMYVEKDRTVWLNGSYSFCLEPRGTNRLKVIRQNSQYACDITLCRDSRWSANGPMFFGDFTPLPVSRIIK
jgi:hypothetical protein